MDELATALGGRVARQAAANSTQLSYQQSQPTFRGVRIITYTYPSPHIKVSHDKRGTGGDLEGMVVGGKMPHRTEEEEGGMRWLVRGRVYLGCDDALPVFTFKLGQTAWVWVCVRTCVGVRSCACVRLVCLPAGRRSCLPPSLSACLSACR
ncbi:hypothetical protein E2C01_034697 [Portunus trituberculatus]|uniref:Uncharacterized protein n=1 Tax=Portunus trituberculatus TaxID=210409 RepID=A0A5B7F7P8_PORTR|nr:hypothetical protein [Portunus trituberculatus]